MSNERLSDREFILAILAAIRLRGYKVLRVDGTNFAKEFAMLAPSIEEEADKFGVLVRFRIRPHEIHRNSQVVDDALIGLLGYIYTLDAPGNGPMRFTIGTDDARTILDRMPFSIEFWLGLADRFIWENRGELA